MVEMLGRVVVVNAGVLTFWPGLSFCRTVVTLLLRVVLRFGFLLLRNLPPLIAYWLP